MAKSVDAVEQTNTLDPKRIEKIIKKIEDEHDGLLSERMSYMSRCRPYRERIAQHYEEGIGFGIPKKILKAKIKERSLQREIDGIADDFEDDDRSMFDQVSQALGAFGDTPLGNAAKAAAAKEDATPEKSKRGRRKAPSAEAKPGAVNDQPASDATTYDDPPTGEGTEAYKRGYEARKAGSGCSIPAELKGDDRDHWHNGWLAADAEVRNADAAAENTDRLNKGLAPLH